LLSVSKSLTKKLLNPIDNNPAQLSHYNGWE